MISSDINCKQNTIANTNRFKPFHGFAELWRDAIECKKNDTLTSPIKQLIEKVQELLSETEQQKRDEIIAGCLDLVISAAIDSGMNASELIIAASKYLRNIKSATTVI